MFRSLLGETALERKLRFIMGSVLLISITGGMWWFANQCESLIRETSRHQARWLVDAALIKHHFVKSEQGSDSEFHEPDFVKQWASALESQKYSFSFLRPKSNGEGGPEDEFEWRVLDRFGKSSASAASHDAPFVEFQDRRNLAKDEYHYYQAVRAKKACINCHLALGTLGGQELSTIAPGDLMAVAKIVIPNSDAQRLVNYMRATWLSASVGITFMAMCISFLMIRWLVVRPERRST